jgi:acyl-coenzyme A thioesterase PaaI-like protein
VTGAPDRSLQETHAPEGRCFGCGPANGSGLRIRSFEADDGTVVATWTARPEHEAFGGFVNGGIIGTLIDCHSNWAAIAHQIRTLGLQAAPATVTSVLSIQYRRPTPSDVPIRLVAKVIEADERRATVETTVEAGGEATATGRATFVTVGPGHPAHDRWVGGRDAGRMAPPDERPTG